jgi:hypothetical protein
VTLSLIFFGVIALALSIAFPKFGKAVVLFTCLPFLGFVFGGFLWAIAALMFHSLVSMQAFAVFVVLATIAAYVVFVQIKE